MCDNCKCKTSNLTVYDNGKVVAEPRFKIGNEVYTQKHGKAHLWVVRSITITQNNNGTFVIQYRINDPLNRGGQYASESELFANINEIRSMLIAHVEKQLSKPILGNEDEVYKQHEGKYADMNTLNSYVPKDSEHEGCEGCGNCEK